MTGEEASSVYDVAYGQMPIPATAFATSSSALRSSDVQPSVKTVASNASVVNRRNRRNGIVSIGGYHAETETTPQMLKPVESSTFQPYLIGPQVDWTLNRGWYIVYPAATVMLGGQRNLALSTRVDQLPTRTTGGPGAAAMTPAPRFKSVQTVPRYSTMPSTYPTSSAPG